MGQLAKFIHAKNGSMLSGFIVAVDEFGCFIRTVDGNGLKMLASKVEINDKIYMVKEYRGDTLF